MKVLAFYLAVFGSFVLRSQNTVNFTYDNAGNNILRSIQITQLGARINPSTNSKNDTGFINDSTIQFKIYPNPTSSYINIEGDLPSDTETANIRLINGNGKIIHKDSYQGIKKIIYLNDIMEGLYILEIECSKKKSAVYKVVINK